MAELFRNAGLGWTDYVRSGKLVVLLLASLMFLWFGRKQREQRDLLRYTTIMTLCCILPVTAVLLMLYQTRFYDYEWIWSLVPLTGMAAYGITVFLTEYGAEAGREKEHRKAPVLFLLLAAVLLSGDMGNTVGEWDRQKTENAQAQAVLERLGEEYPGGDICLWAPREILEYVRETDGSLRLPYGRNMWDLSLNGYSYDTYEESTIRMYQWMEWVGETGRPDMKVQLPKEGDGSYEEGGRKQTERTIRLEDSVSHAIEMGVNCILISENAGLDAVKRMERALGVKARLLEGYYFFKP